MSITVSPYSSSFTPSPLSTVPSAAFSLPVTPDALAAEFAIPVSEDPPPAGTFATGSRATVLGTFPAANRARIFTPAAIISTPSFSNAVANAAPLEAGSEISIETGDLVMGFARLGWALLDLGEGFPVWVESILSPYFENLGTLMIQNFPLTQLLRTTPR